MATLRKILTHFWYRFQWNIRPYFKIPGSYPLAVDVELANGCNFRCSMCQQATGWLKAENRKLMDFELFKKIVRECKTIGVYSMKLNWRGESMLHPRIVDCVRFMKDTGIHEVMLNTNGSLMTLEKADGLILAGLDRIIFSCDGITKETYESIRKGGNFEDFVRNVKTFRRLRELRHGKTRIRINCAIQDKNRYEIPRFKDYWAGIADEFHFSGVFSPQNQLKEKRKKKSKGCPQIYQRLVIDVEGNIIPCCADYLEKLVLGNATVQSLKRVYRSMSGHIRYMHEHHKARLLEGCEKCDLFALSELKDGKVVWN